MVLSGVWCSLVVCFVWDEEVVGLNFVILIERLLMIVLFGVVW